MECLCKCKLPLIPARWSLEFSIFFSNQKGLVVPVFQSSIADNQSEIGEFKVVRTRILHLKAFKDGNVSARDTTSLMGLVVLHGQIYLI
jgi:hypothetical protein